MVSTDPRLVPAGFGAREPQDPGQDPVAIGVRGAERGRVALARGSAADEDGVGDGACADLGADQVPTPRRAFAAFLLSRAVGGGGHGPGPAGLAVDLQLQALPVEVDAHEAIERGGRVRSARRLRAPGTAGCAKGGGELLRDCGPPVSPPDTRHGAAGGTEPFSRISPNEPIGAGRRARRSSASGRNTASDRRRRADRSRKDGRSARIAGRRPTRRLQRAARPSGGNLALGVCTSVDAGRSNEFAVTTAPTTVDGRASSEEIDVEGSRPYPAIVRRDRIFRRYARGCRPHEGTRTRSAAPILDTSPRMRVPGPPLLQLAA